MPPSCRTSPGAPLRGAATATAVAALLLASAVHAPSAQAAQLERVVIGTSVQGRPIVAIHRWHAAEAGPVKKVLVIGNIHGDERAGLRVVKRLKRRALPPHVDMWLIRTINPDGTAAHRRTNAHRVDLNRNFPRRWVSAGRGTAKWSGPSAASEPETRALRRFVRQLQPRTTLVFHQPLHGVDSYRAKSMRLVRALSREAGLPVKSFDCYGGCHGTFTDWHNDRTRGRAVTIEFGSHPSKATVGRVTRGALRVLAAY